MIRNKWFIKIHFQIRIKKRILVFIKESFAVRKRQNGQKRTLEVLRSSNNALKRSSESLKRSSDCLKWSSECLKRSSESLKQSSENLKQSSESVKQSSEGLKQSSGGLLLSSECLKWFAKGKMLLFFLKIKALLLFDLFVIDQL